MHDVAFSVSLSYLELAWGVGAAWSVHMRPAGEGMLLSASQRAISNDQTDTPPATHS